MFHSLHIRLMLVLMTLIVAAMAVVGVSLINFTTSSQVSDFTSQIARVFTPEFISGLEENIGSPSAPEILRSIIEAYSSPLGIDEHRDFYILSAEGECLEGTSRELAAGITPNVISAMTGQVGQKQDGFASYFDVAIPLRDESGVRYIIDITDDRTELDSMTLNTFSVVARAIVIGLLASVLLSFILSKAITIPVEQLTDQARRIADGDFSVLPEARSGDEIGVLTDTFNDMAYKLSDTLKKIEDERDKLDAIFNHMSDGIVAADRSGSIIHINMAAQRMTGRSIPEGADIKEIFPDIDPSGYSETDYIINGKSLKIYTASFGEEDRGGVIAVIHDVTEQEELQKSQKEFVANVSHELRSPLTSIKGYSDTLIDAGDEIDLETRSRFLSIISREADSMTGIVSDLLTLSRLDYGRDAGDTEIIDPAQICLSVTELEKIYADERGITLFCEIEEGLSVFGSKAKLRQVIMNLVSNAIKYNRPSGEVRIEGRRKDGLAVITVSDTGIGIPESDLPRVFDRFYRVDKARSRERGGTGLGLAIAKEITEKMGGTIRAESRENEGTVFTVALPLAEGQYGEG